MVSLLISFVTILSRLHIQFGDVLQRFRVPSVFRLCRRSAQHRQCLDGNGCSALPRPRRTHPKAYSSRSWWRRWCRSMVGPQSCSCVVRQSFEYGWRGCSAGDQRSLVIEMLIHILKRNMHIFNLLYYAASTKHNLFICFVLTGCVLGLKTTQFGYKMDCEFLL